MAIGDGLQGKRGVRHLVMAVIRRAARRVVRDAVPPFDEDRPRGPGIEHLESEALATGRLLAAVGESSG